MGKKDFRGGLNSLLGESLPQEPKEISMDNIQENDKRRVGRPQTQFKEVNKTSEEGTKENETRATFIVKQELLEKIKTIAYWERIMIKDVINQSLQDAVDKYESEKGEIHPLPPKR